MENPYNTPAAPMTEPQALDASYEPTIFSMTGRIGRLRYLAYSAILFAMALAYFAYWMFNGMSAIMTGGAQGWAGQIALIAFGIPFFLFLSFAHIVFAVRRINDTDNSGWLVLLTFVPVIGHLFWFFLIFYPGTDGRNQYGPAPSANPPWVMLTGIGLPFVLIGAVVAFMTFFFTTFFAGMR